MFTKQSRSLTYILPVSEEIQEEPTLGVSVTFVDIGIGNLKFVASF